MWVFVALFLVCGTSPTAAGPTAPAPTAPPATPRIKVTGALDRATVEPRILQHTEALASCRERPEVALDLELEVGADGRVTRARSPKFPDRAKTADCLTHRARFWTFPAAKGASRITIQWR